jgi:hypothetical protein
VRDRDRRNVSKLLQSDNNSAEARVFQAVKNGLLDFCVVFPEPNMGDIEKYIQDEYDLDTAAFAAAYFGKVGLLNFFLEQMASEYEAVLGAVQAGNQSLVDDLIAKNTPCRMRVKGDAKEAARISNVIFDVALADNQSIMDYLITKGANRSIAVLHAAEFDKYDLMNHLLNVHDTNIEYAIMGAAQAGNQPLMDHLITKGANKIHAIFYAAYADKHDLTNHLLKNVHGWISYAIRGAAQAGNQSLVDHLITKGADKDGAVFYAAFFDKRDLMKHLLNVHGANIDFAIRGASRGKKNEVLQVLLALKPTVTATSKRPVFFDFPAQKKEPLETGYAATASGSSMLPRW